MSEVRLCISCRVNPARCQHPTPEQEKKVIYSLCEKCYCRLNREELQKRQLQFDFNPPKAEPVPGKRVYRRGHNRGSHFRP